MASKEPVFVILRRNARGGVTREASKEARPLAPGGFEFKLRKSPDKKILQELQALLPKNVRIAEGNPFAVLKVTPTPRNQPLGAGRCQCQCGTLTGSTTPCGGGGGGGGALV